MDERLIVLSGYVKVKLHDGLVTLLTRDANDVTVVELDHADMSELITLLETAKAALETQIKDTGV